MVAASVPALESLEPRVGTASVVTKGAEISSTVTPSAADAAILSRRRAVSEVLILLTLTPGAAESVATTRTDAGETSSDT